jgi:dTDP-4-amino-4,6-dideoxygalactose transaminase
LGNCKLGFELITVTKPSLPELDKYVEYLKRIWASKWITNNGPYVQLLEEKLRRRLNVEELVLVCNGTLALQLALRVFDLKGEVVTTPFTFAATTNSILWEGLTPVFADIDADTFNIDPEDVERKITDRTRAILAVHVYGNPCNVEELKMIADKHNLKLIYDGAHSFDVEYKNQSVFNYGDISTLSFHATKVFNTIEGGALVINNRRLAAKLRLLRDHGIKSEDEIVEIGTNAKMNEFQAAMGLCNLEQIDHNIELRSRLYKRYVDILSKSNGIKFQKLVASKYNYAYMPVLFENQSQRDRVHDELLQNGIGPRKYFYPLAVNVGHYEKKKVNPVEKFRLKTAFDVTQRVLCLPLYPELPFDDVDKISRIIKQIAH